MIDYRTLKIYKNQPKARFDVDIPSRCNIITIHYKLTTSTIISY